MQPSCAVRVVSGCSSHARCSKGGQVCIIKKLTTTLVSCKVPTYLLGWLQLMTSFGVFPSPPLLCLRKRPFLLLQFHPLSPPPVIGSWYVCKECPGTGKQGPDNPNNHSLRMR
ncbi:uncharacterized protein BO87DRAFT_62397 [Aspergillus neoniger CBS 115656]|uniref:Uncharacterized protein n=1 Tax=Aspergillus neoniger (strain CBS 115656) TaxID=1448310 RepID=A0A318YMW5_ASPNB|nr:hypothetical protein BO87DRAFT_62397 [Aspergillus neoniger CBS 115656]PYH34073.1 hypothetical protein BO87DRAFT_62397 [Aspergillus neoniger CBS 115656]